jgi:hypothetical protein
MRKLFSFSKKFALVFAILAIGLAAVPASGALAAGFKTGNTPPANDSLSNGRLDKMWARAQRVYNRQGFLLSLTGGFISRVQVLIDRATANGWDFSAVQSALNAFEEVIPAANTAHEPGAAIIAAHNGFGPDGKVTDRTAAIATINSLAQVIQNTRSAMNGTGAALKEAVRTFRANHPATQVTPTP